MRCPAGISLFIIVLLVQSLCTYGQEPPDFIYHIVKKNESARQISLLFNVPVDSIRKWNYLDRNYRVIEGMQLIIKHPQAKSQEESNFYQDFNNKSDLISQGSPETDVHIVTDKENLFRISLLYHVSVDSIRRWNNLNQNSIVIVGQRLFVSRQKLKTPVYKITSSEKLTSDNGLAQVPYTSKHLEKVLPPDSVITATQRNFLSIYSESVEKDRGSTFYAKVLFYYNKAHYLFKIILFLNLFFMTSVIIMFIIVFSRRLWKGYIAFKRNKCKNRYCDFITDWLYEEHTMSVPESLINELKDWVNRDVFTSELLSLHANLTGDSAEKLVELFHLAGLKKYSIRKVQHSFWHVKAKGFRELAQMKFKEGNRLISKYLNSGNAMLRLEAQLAWIQLNPDDPLSFYDDPKIQLTEWGLLNSLLSLKKIDTIPDFGRWLQSSNKSVTLSALKMSGIFKQFENVDLVTQRLDDTDPEIRHEAICALGKMALLSPGYKLQQRFPKEELKNRTEIIRSLTMISDSSYVPLFEDVLLNETDINLRILTAKGLISLDGIGSDRLDSVFRKADSVLQKIIIHAKDDRI